MKCPFCKTNLVPGEQKRFETLGEHVCNQNMVSHPLRNTFVCPNENCDYSSVSYWNEDGEFYYTGDYKKFNWNVSHSPYGSMWRKIDMIHILSDKVRKILESSPVKPKYVYGFSYNLSRKIVDTFGFLFLQQFEMLK